MENLPFDINSIGITEPNKSYVMTRNKNNNPLTVFEFVTKGKIHVQVDNIQFTAQAGDTYILTPNTNQHYYSDSKTPVRKIWINIESEYLPNLLNSHNLSANAYHINTADLFENIFEIVRSGQPYKQMCSKISQIVFKIILRLSQFYDNNDEDICEKIKNYIETVLYSQFDYNVLSKQLLLSQSALIRNFKKNYGITPYEYYLREKNKLAITFLTNTHLSISAISDRLGYGDVHYFSNTFKKRVGVSPQTFRDNLTIKSNSY